MLIARWFGYIRFLVPIFLIYIFYLYGSEEIINRQPLEAWTLFKKVGFLAILLYVLATASSRIANLNNKNIPLIAFFALNAVGLVIFTVILYLGAVLMNNRCASEPAKAHVVMAVDYVYSRVFTPASVKVKDWANPAAERWLSLQSNQLQQFTPPALVTAFVQPGAFGYDWLLDLRLGTQLSTTKNPNASLPAMPQTYCRIGSALLGG